MNKKLVMLFSGLVLVGLTACGDTTSDDGMSVQDILDESISTMESLDSYSMSMDMTQVMNLGEEEGMTIGSKGEVSLTTDPMTMMQTTKMNMGDLGMAEDEEMVYLSYFTEEDGFFVEDPMTSSWVKAPDNLTEEMLAMSDVQMSPEEQLKPFNNFISDLTVDTTDDAYIITLSGDGVDMDELMAQMGGLGLEGMDPMISEMMGQIDIQSLNYQITIDRETFYQIESNIDMTMSMELMGESMSTEQTIHMALYDFNAVDQITIPQEVLDNAEEMTEEDMLGSGL